MSERPVQQRVRLRSITPEGAYHRLVLDAGQVARTAQPGQFVALSVGGADSAMLLRRCFSIAGRREGGIELLIAARGKGSTWLTQRRPGTSLDVIGPLGGPFPPAPRRAGVVLVGGGYGAAPLLWFAEELIARGRAASTVQLVLGAASQDRLAGVEQARALGAGVHVTTDDGSAGIAGRVTAAVPAALAAARREAPRESRPAPGSAPAAGSGSAETAGPPVEVYACGPMAMLRAVSEVAAEHGSPTWCAVEESMACGVGVCMTCVLPIRGADGVVRNLRTCTDGPTFDARAIVWDQIPSLTGGSR
ncbi:MAG: hypothetical protein JNL54_01315 [Kineosporiaceae bacterium]|nr:hypothetical protein [Kineosporiaceae bacterium]